MEQVGSHWTDFHEIWYLSIFKVPVGTNHFAIKSLHEDQYTLLIISHSFLLIIKNVSDKFAEKIKISILSSVKSSFCNLFMK